ncbi:hypothetical protein [Agrobacterium tumefaciens]|uniref:hypothetical protein n=1 Tax=Agrobacterium tumefaciens TaxID=358 RepID=UPI00045B243E|nr:hypothetical protein [Agrobacterium tumefaciens]CDN96057.1 hypothetical protein BN949_05231 [Agrobacterium tumefaciens]
MIKPAKFLATGKLNGKDVSFFLPPHDEPDFIWVDIGELAAAYLPEAEAVKLVRVAQALTATSGFRPVSTAANGDKISTIGSHPVAQAVCRVIDVANGNTEENGPVFLDYCFMSADLEYDHRTLGMTGIIAASKNQGGPFLRTE